MSENLPFLTKKREINTILFKNNNNNIFDFDKTELYWIEDIQIILNSETKTYKTYNNTYNKTYNILGAYFYFDIEIPYNKILYTFEVVLTLKNIHNIQNIHNNEDLINLEVQSIYYDKDLSPINFTATKKCKTLKSFLGDLSVCNGNISKSYISLFIQKI